MPVLKGRMGKIKLFPTTEHTSKQALDPVVPLVPCTGIFLGPSKSGKTVALISLILEQYRGVFERIYVFSPSVNIDDGWIPVKNYIEEDLGVNTECEQAYWDEWDEPALRRIIQQQRKITEASKKLEMKKLYQVLIIIDDYADSPQLHKSQHAIPLLLEAAQPARAAERTAAEGAAVPAVRAGDPRTLQLPLCVLPEAKERNVLQALRRERRRRGQRSASWARSCSPAPR